MAERIVSPGVFTRERDLSFLPQGIAQIGAAIIGPTVKGPAFVPTVVSNFPDFEDPCWIRRSKTHRFQQMKLKIHDEEKMPALIRHVLNQFNSATFLKFLENLTGINGLIPDPYFHGAGMHQIENGGHLGIHVDFNWLEKLRLDRRVSILLHLNEDWKEEYGGHLELWNQDVQNVK